MKRDYSKWCSVALIAAIYTIAGVAGWLLFEGLANNTLTANPLVRLFLADVLATIIVWAFGLLYENVSVYFLGISIPLMEKRQLANKPDYAEYRKQTRILI